MPTAFEEWLSLANKLNEQTALMWRRLKLYESEIASLIKQLREWKVAADTVGERLIATELKLEKCEAELKKQAQDHLHYINGHQQIEDELKERLEKCETALHYSIESHCQTLQRECGCATCITARAALEGK